MTRSDTLASSHRPKRARLRLWWAARGAAVLALSIAVVFKVDALLRSAPPGPVELSRALAVVSLEVFVAGALAIAPGAPWLRWMAAAFWSVLAATSIRSSIAGETTCGCFGDFSVSPWWTFGFDAALALMFLLSRPPSRGVSPARRDFVWWCGLLATILLLDGAISVVAIRQWNRANNIAWAGYHPRHVFPGTPWKRDVVLRKLAKDIPISRGRWILVFYDPRCSACRAVLKQVARTATRADFLAPFHLVLVRVRGNPPRENEMRPTGDPGEEVPSSVQQIEFEVVKRIERHWYGRREIRIEISVPGVVVLRDGVALGGFGDLRSAIAALDEQSPSPTSPPTDRKEDKR